MLTELAIAAAVALTPLAAPANPPAASCAVVPGLWVSCDYQPAGTVVLRWYDSTTPVGPLRLPIGPECWGLQVTAPLAQTNGSVCVDRATYDAHPIGSHYEGA